MTRFGLFMFHVCALAWTLVALSVHAFAQCDVEVATSLVFFQGEPAEGYGLSLEAVAEHTTGNLAGLTTYRLYMNTAHPTDRVIAVVGDNEFPLSLMPETAFYQNPFGNSNPEGISPDWIANFPNLAYDSWVTIGLDGPSSAGEEGVTMLFASGWESVFNSGQGFVEESENGSGWTVIPWTATNTIAGPEQRVLLAQLTTDGHLSGSMRVQVFPQGDNENDLRLDVTFDTNVVCGCIDEGAANFNADANTDDGSCVFGGCTDPGACNYDASVSMDDGSCVDPNFDLFPCGCEGVLPDAAGLCGGGCEMDADADGVCDDVDDCIGVFDECGICNGPGNTYECGCADIPDGDCDCNGNQLDVLGVCGGPCDADEDGDGVCDDVDDCVGALDDCSICNGPGAIYECGCADIPEGDCDCNGNQLDALGVCGGTCTADADEDGVCDDEDDCVGEFDECGECNGPGAVFECGCDKIEDGECDCDGNVEDVLGVCGGDCIADDDDDGICDDVDECVGELDECGECNGPGAVYECGCDKIQDGECDCDGNILDVLGECGGGCMADVDHDGICDDDDDCVGDLDACGVCNGPGAVYECGCNDIQDGECDCFGSEEDAIGVCGGGCDFDMDFDGICDDEDACIGTLDACGICNGPGAIYPCGCDLIPVGDCDCDENQVDAVGECGGNCTEDADEDGICDNVDGCVGEFDECGVCNGPGDIYECGCDDIPVGDCDCNGNQLDALGVCGGTCTADVDGDGVCDDVDSCVGEFDECGICNGPGAVLECGCADIPAEDCDCNGNQLDALGVCGGTCAADADEDGVCDDVDSCVGEFDECGICNGPGAVLECGCNIVIPGFCDCDWNQYDALGVCGGTCTADADGDGVCDDEDDCVGAFDACGVCNGPGDVYECGCADIPAGDCDCHGNQLDALGTCGGACEADIDEDGVCDDEDDCAGVFDECGVCNGPGEVYECGCDDIPAGDCNCEGNQLDALGVCGGACDADVDEDGVCDNVDDCVGVFDECGVCNGPGEVYECGCADIPAEDCDCNGNQLDALGVCGGTCDADVDGDGVCDDEDDCVGAFDACGVCNGPGDVYECGCADIPAGDCDCNGNQLDALGVCGGTCTTDEDEDGVCDDEDDCVGALDTCGVCNGPGDVYECGCADIPAEDCDCNGNQLDALGVCGGTCAADADEDGVCDDVDSCVGEFDECGICNGPGEVDECGCDDIPAGDCDCDGNQLDALGVCGGACDADVDGDGVCDDVDSCVGEFDACGICNGSGAVLECGCADIPAEDCDCNGNQLDALGVCGGACDADVDGDGVCDNEDDCVGVFDECGVCNGPGEVYECGCDDIPAGDCNCEGNQLDALGVCGGACDADVDGDGVCDDVDSCVGEFDACGICNGSGAVLECGCADIPAEDCDCNGNQLDALGVCGGACDADVDGDGVCDDVDSCVGEFDACGICNGSGAVLECGCADIPAEDCDCNGNQLDALGVCGGTCDADVDGDGVCDNEDDCVGALDTCGVCNGPGDVYECGCADIPAGDCDCNGNQLDTLGVCGGTCAADADDDGVCDDVDSCVGEFDECGICNGPGEVDECGCDDIPAGDCDCDGNQLDALGVCGGACDADVDGDGVCDDGDSCVGEFDECGICNGPGAVLECGCQPLAPWACDCEGNVFDVCGECGGTGTLGCLDGDACNYNGEACGSDGSCVYATPGLDCDGNVIAVEGCTDGLAPNFNPAANLDDGSCFVGGCIVPSACNFNSQADFYVDGACEFDSCVGCMHEAACNFDPEATLGSLAMCTYPMAFYLGCDGACLNDVDGDGICDELEIPGCTSQAAPNFNPYATDDNGTCVPPLVGGCILPFACNYDEGATFYIPGSCDFECLYGASGSSLCTAPEACNVGEDGPCEFMSCLVLGCTLGSACNFNPEATVHDGSCEFNSCGGCMNPLACDFEPTATIHTGCADFASCVGCTDPHASNHDPNATVSGWCSHSGCTLPEACNYDANANVSDGTCEFDTCVGCTVEDACNYDPGATIAGFCDFPPAHFDCEGNCLLGDCSAFVVWGCTEGCACNYNPSANMEDGTCDHDSCIGCVYPSATNYDATATRDDGSCVFMQCAGLSCMDPLGAADFNGDGEVQVQDLMQLLTAYTLSGPHWGNLSWVQGACASPTRSLGEMLADVVAQNPIPNPHCGAQDCTYSQALNYQPESSSYDGGICVFAGCTDDTAVNYDPMANVDDGGCRHAACPDLNGDGLVQAYDLLDFLWFWHVAQ